MSAPRPYDVSTPFLMADADPAALTLIAMTLSDSPDHAFTPMQSRRHCRVAPSTSKKWTLHITSVAMITKRRRTDCQRIRSVRLRQIESTLTDHSNVLQKRPAFFA